MTYSKRRLPTSSTFSPHGQLRNRTASVYLRTVDTYTIKQYPLFFVPKSNPPSSNSRHRPTTSPVLVVRLGKQRERCRHRRTVPVGLIVAQLKSNLAMTADLAVSHVGDGGLTH